MRFAYILLLAFALAFAADNVKVEFYYEVLCPDCSEMMVGELKQYHELDDMMAITDFEFVAFGNGKVLTREPPTFKCQHGEKECYGNMVELCAIKHNPWNYWDFLLCEESSLDFSDEGVTKCAKAVGIIADEILTCAKGTEGPLLHLDAADNTPEHLGVPWVIVNGRLMGESERLIDLVCAAYEGEKPESCKYANVEKVKATLYYEVYCPGCRQFISNDLVEFRKLDDMMAITDLELVPYGNAHVLTRDPPTFKCQHGDEECYGNWVELCAQKYNPENWWNYILCEEQSEDFSDEGITKCAKSAGINAEEILTCAHGTEGPLLHLEAADKTPDHKWVPWVIVDGKVMGEEDEFLQMVCDAYKGEKPASCKKSSNVEKVKATLYYEVYCPGCQEFISNDLVEFRKLDDMMAITDLELVPYGNAHVLTRDPPTFKCQHGDKECYGNWVELCAQKYNPENWWNYILCEEESADFSDEGITKCAKSAGINAEEILTCAHGTEGPLLHLEAADKTPDHKWVPWVIVDGKVMGEEDEFLQMVCDAYKGEKPASCKKQQVAVVEPKKVEIALYYEVLCSTCVFFMIGDLNKLHKKQDLMDIVNIDMAAFGNGRVLTRDPPTFWCQHGEKECFGNMVELCAVEHYPETYWDFVLCMEMNGKFEQENINECAAKAGLDVNTIMECANGDEGLALHLAAADRTPPEHTYVPWVTVNGELMKGKSLIEMVCDAYEGEKPESCKTY